MLAFEVDISQSQKDIEALLKLYTCNDLLIGMKNRIPANITNSIYVYENRDQFERFLHEHNVTIFLRFDSENKITNSYPMSSITVLVSSNSSSGADIIINQELTKDNFEKLVIEPSYRIVKTKGYQNDKMVNIFTGTSVPTELVIFKHAKYEPENTNAIQNLKNVLTNVTEQNKNKSSYKVKPLCNWTSTQQLIDDWKKMFLNNSKLEFVNSDDVDYYVIINKPQPNDKYDPSRTIVFRMEPYIENNPFYNDWYNKKENFLYFLEHNIARNNTEWWLSSTVEDLHNTVNKNMDNISTVVSSQYSMEGHKLRIEFVKYFQTHSKKIMDVFGHDNKFELQNYKGSLPTRAKDKGIFPYKYHFAAENSSIKNYFTEKFYDAILGECLLFYWGCPNVEDFIDSRAFIRLDLHNPQKSLEIIETSINNDEWGKRIHIIKREKEKIIYNFNFFPRVLSLIHASKIKYYILNNKIPDGIVTNNIEHINIPYTTMPFDACLLLKHFSYPQITLQQYNTLYQHYQAWVKINSQLEDNCYCIINGNTNDNFLDHLTTIISTNRKDYDILFLNYNGEQARDYNILFDFKDYVTNYSKEVETPSGKMRLLNPNSFGSAYLISKNGVKKLLEIISVIGLCLPLEEFLLWIITNTDIKSLLYYKDLFELKELPAQDINQTYRVLRQKNANEFVNTMLPLKYPPENTKNVILLPEKDFQAKLKK